MSRLRGSFRAEIIDLDWPYGQIRVSYLPLQIYDGRAKLAQCLMRGKGLLNCRLNGESLGFGLDHWFFGFVPLVRVRRLVGVVVLLDLPVEQVAKALHVQDDEDEETG